MSNHNQENGHGARKLNFGAGPAQLPLEVLESVQAEFLNFNGSGSNIMGRSRCCLVHSIDASALVELSHRSSAFAKVILDAETGLRDIL